MRWDKIFDITLNYCYMASEIICNFCKCPLYDYDRTMSFQLFELDMQTFCMTK